MQAIQRFGSWLTKWFTLVVIVWALINFFVPATSMCARVVGRARALAWHIGGIGALSMAGGVGVLVVRSPAGNKDHPRPCCGRRQGRLRWRFCTLNART